MKVVASCGTLCCMRRKQIEGKSLACAGGYVATDAYASNFPIGKSSKEHVGSFPKIVGCFRVTRIKLRQGGNLEQVHAAIEAYAKNAVVWDLAKKAFCCKITPGAFSACVSSFNEAQ